jgi:hypothetical protein
MAAVKRTYPLYSDTERRRHEAFALMMHFAARTGLTAERPVARYLWTDAFAVCNLLGISRATGDLRCKELALQLIDRVHHKLGRHRVDDPRSGYISGLSDEEGELHPTIGGLRIGKLLAERRAGEHFDPDLEWDRDGQYFHYLTKWMLALDQAARATHQPRFNLWARELAGTAHRAFRTHPRGGKPGVIWKMSIDLSRPLVAAMGQHDPLDGYVTTAQLRATAWALAPRAEGPALDDELASYREMLSPEDWTTADPLGLGGMLVDATRLAQLVRREALPDLDVIAALLEASLRGLEHYARHGSFKQEPLQRLAFRELGLAIGLSALDLLDFELQAAPQHFSDSSHLRSLLSALRPFEALGAELGEFWAEPANQHGRRWTEHLDINEVMLATSLVPEGFLMLPTLL